MGIAAGTQLGRYEIRNLLGAGGMGEVYLAQDTKLGRTVAVKILPIEIASDQRRMQRFVQEARAASALNHPNIITIYEIEQADSGHFIVTELINGETLRQHMTRARIMFPEAFDISIQIASALSAAHQAGIIHRDIKPENIMLRPDGIVKVLDFGLAKLATTNLNADVDAEAPTRELINTEAGSVMGTAHYMSPEQARGVAVDARTDIWSLGVVLYEMVAGHLPFNGETTTDVIAAIIKTSFPPLARFRPDAPPALEEIILKALEKDPAERYQRIQELLVDLRRLQKRLEFEARLEQLEEPEGARARKVHERITQVLDSVGPTAEEQAPRRSKTLTDSESNTVPSLPPNNLSMQRTDMVGRGREIEEICSELRREGIRLLTLTGVGGTGKSTLAEAVARQLLPEFSDGVFYIALAAIKQPELVASSIAQPLGVKESEGRSIVEALQDYLRNRNVLLVVDNFEQVVAARSVLAELLASAPRLKMLVTSRELLHLSLEHEYMVPPLALPESLAQVSAGDLSRYEAVRLFVERARAMKANFALTDENAQSVVEICVRLEGLPLAIELASARVRVLSPQAILARLDSRLNLLTGGARDLPTRQQTMRGAVEWSYELLTEDEKSLFRWLAVFEGGFTFSAAAAVVGSQLSVGPKGEAITENAITDIEPLMIDPLDGVTSLVDKSLLVAKEQADGELRFRMLEVVREYALDRLESGGESEATRRNHAAYFLALAEESEPHLQGWRPAKWLDRLEEEHDNLRAALRWSLACDVETAVRLAAAIRYLWIFQGYLTEGLRWLESILKLGHNVPSAARWKILSVAGNMARFQGDHEKARMMYEEGLTEGRAAHDLPQISLSCRGLGGLALEQGDYPTARRFDEEALAIARQSNDKFGIARSLSMLGDLARTVGDDATARPLYEEALAICRQLGNQFAIGNILTNLAAAEYGDGDHTAAQSHFAESLKMAHGSGDKIVGDKISISYTLDGFAALAVSRGESELATELAGAAEQLRESINYNIEPAERRFRDAYLAPTRATLSEAVFSAAYSKGRRLKLDEAVALALGSRGTMKQATD
jgi:predicted ATPase/tRNA A-37 threonylcarbamoyl transferase component Bud32